MISLTNKSSKLVSIKGTAKKHSASIFWLTPMHVLSGCDTVPKMCGIVKVTALKIMVQNPLKFLGQSTKYNLSDVRQQVCKDMSEIR